MPNLVVPPETLYAEARAAGWNQSDATIAAAIAMAESGDDSGSNPLARNSVPPDDSYGPWQINMIGDLGPARRAEFGLANNDALYDPGVNAKVAHSLFAGSGWQPWSTYTSGAYLAHLGRAQAAAATVGDNIQPYIPKSSGHSVDVTPGGLLGAAAALPGKAAGAVANSLWGSARPIVISAVLALGATALVVLGVFRTAKGSTA